MPLDPASASLDLQTVQRLLDEAIAKYDTLDAALVQHKDRRAGVIADLKILDALLEMGGYEQDA